MTKQIPFHEAFDIDQVPISDILLSVHKQSDYLYLLFDIIDAIDAESFRRTEELISQVIELKKNSGIDVAAYKNLLPNGWLIFSKKAQEFLETHPESNAHIGAKFNIDPASYFRLFEDEKPKGGENDEDTLHKAWMDGIFNL